MTNKMVYICSDCQFESGKWLGKCPQCSAWNSFEEQLKQKKKIPYSSQHENIVQSVRLKSNTKPTSRTKTGIEEFDRVLGGGLMPESFTLLSGEPGIGKSTLALQIVLSTALQNPSGHYVYISGEESAQQISQRAHRIIGDSKTLPSLDIVSAKNIDSACSFIRKHQAHVAIIDSAQTLGTDDLSGLPGSVSQTRMVAEKLLETAKTLPCIIILIGHVNKEGNLAGPKVLEHLVDTVLYFEGDRYQDLRMLRSRKNRFGSTAELGLFLMEENGLKQLQNPSDHFLSDRKSETAGSALSLTVEGARPFLVEIQALTDKTGFNYPKRTALGVDSNRVQLLCAVLNKHTPLQLDQHDVYVNITGGFKVQDPGLDAALLAAIISSHLNISLPEKSIFLGEVSLSGDIRPTHQETKRLKELSQLGVEYIIGCVKKPESFSGKIIPLTHVKHFSTLLRNKQ